MGHWNDGSPWRQKGFRFIIHWLVGVEIHNHFARHYMHMAKMKWHGIIKVLEHNVKTSFEQGELIPNTHVNHEIDNLIEMGHAWMVQSTHHPDVRYKVPLPFTHYMCCMCEWALCGNLCKHQVVVSITCIDFTPKTIIHYCGRWYGSNVSILKQRLQTLHTCTFMMNLMMRNPR